VNPEFDPVGNENLHFLAMFYFVDMLVCHLNNVKETVSMITLVKAASSLH
jgi:hypothetical protein